MPAPTSGETFLTSIVILQKPSHAYLFFGPNSSQKEEKAKIFATTLLCRQTGTQPCGTCLSCRKIQSGNHPDFRIIVPDGAKIKIDQIRGLKKEMRYGPLESQWKICLLFQSERMTEEAAQSLLKILEEPPPGIVMILTAPHPSSILPTLASRCQRIPLQAAATSSRIANLKTLGIPDEQAAVLAGLEIPPDEIDAWKKILSKIPENFFEGLSRPFELFEKISLLSDYKDEGQTVVDLFLAFYRDVMTLKTGWPEGLWLSKFKALEEQAAQKLSWADLWKKIQLVLEASKFLDKSGNFRLVMDILLYKLNN